MFLKPLKSKVQVVALLAEGVDRNLSASYSYSVNSFVALLAEGVDRNCMKL